MNALDSPLETFLAFNPVNPTPLFNNFWALLAVLAAPTIIFSLRRSYLKTTSRITVFPETVSRQHDDEDDNMGVEVEVDEEEEEEGGVVTSCGKNEKFFTVYYEERENEEEGCCVGDDVDGGDLEEEEKSESEMMTWTVEMRGGGELGWYEFQDRRALDGSVVRLWEGERDGNCFSPRGCRIRFNSCLRSSYDYTGNIVRSF